MRYLKITGLLLLLLVLGFFGYTFVVYPAVWYAETRRDSVRILNAARSMTELSNAVGGLGWFVPLTNGAWIAIRYCDIHGGGIQSCSVARDSGGNWYESRRHFCGTFGCWLELKYADIEEAKQQMLTGESSTNGVSAAQEQVSASDFPTYRELFAILSAPDLPTSRRALQKIGFKESKP